MNMQDEKDKTLRAYMMGDLESPFLDEELFNKEAEAEWEGRLANLIADHPFLHGFEDRLWRAAETQSIESDGLRDGVQPGSLREANPIYDPDSTAEPSQVGVGEREEPSQGAQHALINQGKEENLIEFELETNEAAEAPLIDFDEIEKANQYGLVAGKEMSQNIENRPGRYRVGQTESEAPSALQEDDPQITSEEPDSSFLSSEEQQAFFHPAESATVDDASVLEFLYEYGTNPGTLEELIQRVRYLAAGEEILLQNRVESYLTNVLEKQYYMKEGKSAYHALFAPLRCVGTSLYIFSKVCTRILGASALTTNLMLGKEKKSIRYEIPRMAWEGSDGHYVVVHRWPFIHFWVSRYNSPSWKGYKNILGGVCRGAGAAGALRYARLVHEDEFIISQEDEQAWPAGLKAGAFLQLWVDKRAYKVVRDGDTKEKLPPVTGHSCIFREYKKEAGREVIVVADQMSPRHEIPWGKFYNMKYLIGANLKNVKLISRVD